MILKHRSYLVPFSSSTVVARCVVCCVSETARVDVGLAVELWNKGMLWDKLMGTHWLPLTTVKQSNKVC